MGEVLSEDVLQGAEARTPQIEQKLGKLLLDAGKLNAHDAERVLRLQKSEGLRFGDAAIKLGLVKESDIQQALAQQFDYPYLAAGVGGLSPTLVAAYQPFTAQVEQLRALRSQLMLRWFGLGNKSLAIIGVGADSGASDLVANLAVVFSQLGERTLLIDADLRKPTQHQIFNLGNRAGLSDILIGRADLNAVARVESLVGLSVLTSGAVPPNPSELLSRPALLSLLQVYQEQFDVILISSSSTAISDAIPVCFHSGGAVLVARQDMTAMKDLNALIGAARETRTTLVGTVLNRF